MTVRHILARSAARHSVPVDTTIELVAQCNLRCVHCYVSHAKAKKLSFEVLCALFDELAHAGSFGVTLTGGEIGVRPDLFELIAYARRLRFSVSLLTNGTLWGPEDWDRLAELAVAGVRMSLYSTDPAVHDQITGVPGSQERTVATLHGLLARDVRVSLACPVMDKNADSIGALAAFAAAHDISFGIDGNITVTDSGNAEPKQHLASHAQLVQAYREVGRYDEQFAPDESCVPHGSTERPCAAGEMAAFITSEGDVLPCAKWPTPAGNIFEQPFLSIWRTSPVFEHARSITYEDLDQCGTCTLGSICRPCVAMTLTEKQSLKGAADCLCTNTNAKAEAFAVPPKKTL